MTKPKYRRHRRKGRPDLALVELNGRRVYLGEYGSVESKVEYNRVIAEWEARGRKPLVRSEEFTVVELCERFLEHAEVYYRHLGGEPTSEVKNFKTVRRRVGTCSRARSIRFYFGFSASTSRRKALSKALLSVAIRKSAARTSRTSTAMGLCHVWSASSTIIGKTILGAFGVLSRRPV